ncbi:hypothetical protein [Actinoplanes sp. RD1]|uniref:hypothetical protein n=1 Tax=Actinoplanes sp. RD1 TaxID=3064538 RepID=UPI0027412161|nr:hypothetical protein [Actinoplanes sp. RD1]
MKIKRVVSALVAAALGLSGAFLATPAQAAGLSVSLSNAKPVFGMSDDCRTIAYLTVKVYDPDFAFGPGDGSSRLSSGNRFANSWTPEFEYLSRRGSYSSFRAPAVFCGIDNAQGIPNDVAAEYTWTYSFGSYHGSRKLDVRYRQGLDFNASPEPVRKGGTVKLRVQTFTGYEGGTEPLVKFYFRKAGSATWTYRTSVRVKCGDGGWVCSGTRQVTQRASGTWKAVAGAWDDWAPVERVDAVEVR